MYHTFIRAQYLLFFQRNNTLIIQKLYYNLQTKKTFAYAQMYSSVDTLRKNGSNTSTPYNFDTNLHHK